MEKEVLTPIEEIRARVDRVLSQLSTVSGIVPSDTRRRLSEAVRNGRVSDETDQETRKILRRLGYRIAENGTVSP
jgi:hypothetical protein